MVLVNGKCNWRKKPRLLRGTAAAPTRTFIRSPSLASPPQRYKTFCYFHVCRQRDSWSYLGGRLPVIFFAVYPRYSKNCLENQRFMKNCISHMSFPTKVKYGMAQIHSAVFWSLCWHAVGPPPGFPPCLFNFPSPIRSGCQISMTSTNLQYACRCSLYNSGPAWSFVPRYGTFRSRDNSWEGPRERGRDRFFDGKVA